jgi:hypothetical protein
MQRLTQRAAGFWFAAAPASRLALLRIVIGGYALYWVTDHFDSYMRIADTSRSLFEPVGPVSLLASPLPPPVFGAILIVAIVANVLFVLGAAYRFTGPAFGLLLLWVLSYRNSWGMIFHTDNLLVLHVLILGFTKSADALSVDALQHSSSGSRFWGLVKGWSLRPTQPSWEYGYAVKLLCLVTTLAYFLSGVAKLTGPLGGSWGMGESLRSQVAWDVWRKELLLAKPPQLIYSLYDKLWLFTLFAIGTLVIELGAPLVMLSGWLAAIWVPAALGMHWGIEIIMGIEFPYQLYGVAFAPFIPLDRAIRWPGAAGRWISSRVHATLRTRQPAIDPGRVR